MAAPGVPEQYPATGHVAGTQLGSTRGLSQHCFPEAETDPEALWPTAHPGRHLHQPGCTGQTLGASAIVPQVPSVFSRTRLPSASMQHSCHPLLQATIISALGSM